MEESARVRGRKRRSLSSMRAAESHNNTGPFPGNPHFTYSWHELKRCSFAAGEAYPLTHNGLMASFLQWRTDVPGFPLCERLPVKPLAVSSVLEPRHSFRPFSRPE
jgi:hypothetical protein